MKFNFNETLENEKKYMISLKGEEMLIQDIIEGKYKSDYIIISLETLQKNAKKLLENRFIDIGIQITNPISEGKYNLCIVHFVKTKPQKFLTGIFNGNIFEKNNTNDNRYRKYTKDFNNLILEISNFLNNIEIKRNDIIINDYKEFNIKNLNPLYYTKQAIKIRNELCEKDYRLLKDLVESFSNNIEKDIEVKYMDSTNMKYPFVYSDLKVGKIQRAQKVKKGDIICLLIGKQPKFYLYNEKYEDIYIKLGNYCILRCKEEKYRSYLVNYLNDEKARLYFSTTVHGNYIPHLNKEDLMNLKIVLPDEYMLKTANEIQNYLMDQKKMTPYEINELIRKSYKIDYKKESHKMITNDMILLVSHLKLKVLKELIDNDFNEVEICFKNGAYKAAIILCGSILEAVLLDWLSEFENTDNIFNIAKNEYGRDLELSKIISRLQSVIKPYWYEADKAHEIRKTRNMVHPKEYIKKNKKVTFEECKEIIEDLKDIMESKEKRHNCNICD